MKRYCYLITIIILFNSMIAFGQNQKKSLSNDDFNSGNEKSTKSTNPGQSNTVEQDNNVVAGKIIFENKEEVIGNQRYIFFGKILNSTGGIRIGRIRPGIGGEQYFLVLSNGDNFTLIPVNADGLKKITAAFISTAKGKLKGIDLPQIKAKSSTINLVEVTSVDDRRGYSQPKEIKLIFTTAEAEEIERLATLTLNNDQPVLNSSEVTGIEITAVEARTGSEGVQGGVVGGVEGGVIESSFDANSIKKIPSIITAMQSSIGGERLTACLELNNIVSSIFQDRRKKGIARTPIEKQKDIISAYIKAMKDADPVIRTKATFGIFIVGENNRRDAILSAEDIKVIKVALQEAQKDSNSDVRYMVNLAYGYFK